MDECPRTYDHVLREERRLLLRDAALRAAKAVEEDSPFRLMVTGSLSRGQVHPWSDLDVVLIPTRDGGGGENEILRMETRRRVSDAMDMHDADVVYADEVFDGLKKGMMGSLLPVEDIPSLRDLPDVSVVLARIHVSIGFALEASDRIMADYAASEEKLREIMPDFDRMSCSHAMDPIRRKASLWMKKLAVHADGGRSRWLDDPDDDEALDRLLERLSSPGSAPDGCSSLLEAPAAGSLRYLLVDAYDFLFRRSETECPKELFASIRDAVSQLGRDLEAMAPGVPTHGLST